MLLRHLLFAHTFALDNGVGLTPTMGWGTWNLFGCYAVNWNETIIREMADAMVSSGMKEAGYSYINLDGGWLGGRNTATGAPHGDLTKFPSGIPALVDLATTTCTAWVTAQH